MSAVIRRNEAFRDDERWEPPPFADVATLPGRLKSRLRRVLDLQAASFGEISSRPWVMRPAPSSM
jgi:hypothetical protein